MSEKSRKELLKYFESWASNNCYLWEASRASYPEHYEAYKQIKRLIQEQVVVNEEFIKDQVEYFNTHVFNKGLGSRELEKEFMMMFKEAGVKIVRK